MTKPAQMIRVELTVEEAEVVIAELDAMGHSQPGKHEGDSNERCPACDFLDRLRVAIQNGALSDD